MKFFGLGVKKDSGEVAQVPSVRLPPGVAGQPVRRDPTPSAPAPLSPAAQEIQARSPLNANPPITLPKIAQAYAPPAAPARPNEQPPVMAPPGSVVNVDAKVIPDTREVEGAKLRFCQKPINSESELAEMMTFTRALVEDINMAANLYNNICPVEVSSGSKRVALLISYKMLHSDDLGEIIRMLTKKNYVMLEGIQPNVYVSNVEALILSVARGQISGEDVAKRKRVMGETNDGALWRNFVDVVSWGAKQNASDIHININTMPGEERSQVKFTIDGKYVAPDRWALPSSTLAHIAGVAYQQSRGGNGSNFQPLVEQQCRIFLELNHNRERVMLRWASMATDDGPQITLRILKLDAEQDSISLQGLGYLPSQAAMFERSMTSEGGAIVMAGVVGSGKSTTLATLMKSIPTTRKVMTLEDPREYIIPGAHQNTVSRSMDSDDDTAFSAKLRTLKRTAFNDLLVGEIRDKQTGVAFQDVVESGHNVYTTVHARRHIGIPDRLASPFIGVAREVLATPGILKLLVYQALLPRNCPLCCHPAEFLMVEGSDVQKSFWKEYFDRIERMFNISHHRIKVRNELGCPSCRRADLPNLAGYKGRTVVAEMIEPDETFLECVRDAKNIELENYVASLRQSPMDNEDMIGKSALECAIYKMSLGTIDPREIEPRFEAFQTMELRQQARKAKAQRMGVVKAVA